MYEAFSCVLETIMHDNKMNVTFRDFQIFQNLYSTDNLGQR